MDIVVFDTVVYVRGLLGPYSICGRIIFEYADRYTLATAEPLVRELINVTHRPALTRRFSTLPERDLAATLSILSDATVVEIDERTIAKVCRDPNDDKFLAVALAANARFLVSEDKDLLDLQEYEGVSIVDASTFLSHITEH